MRKSGAFGAIMACVLCIASALAIIIGGVGSSQLIRPASAQQFGPFYCSQMAVSAAGFTTKVQVVPTAPTPNRIFVCGMTVSAVAASVVTFQYGTGTNCATGSTAIGGTIQLGATSTYDDGAAMFRGFLVPAGNALCATATSAANAAIYYGIQ